MRKRQKRKLLGIGLLLLVFGIAACGPVHKEETGTSTPQITEPPASELTQVLPEQPDGLETVKEKPKTTATPVPTEAPTATPMPTHTPARNEGIEIPAEYRKHKKNASGTVEEITYTTKDYYGTGEEMTKPAYVYLPYGYDSEKQYNVLFLMHSGGGDETEWGLHKEFSSAKLVLDNLIYYGDIEPLIVVAVNGRTGVHVPNRADSYNGFKDFGKELREDLIPYIDANYATYAKYSAEGYDATAARDHRAIAGFSFGAMQAINIGLCECYDLISYYGAFSPATATYEAEEIVKCLDTFESYEINGKNLMMQVVPGGHDTQVANLGLYNFLQLIFK